MMGKYPLFFAATFLVLSVSAARAEDVGQAESNYQGYCAPCHGRDGDGNGDLAPSLPVPPRNHTDAAKMSKRTDEQLFKTISEGGEATGFDSAMPPHNTVLSEGEIRDLVKHIRRLCKCQHSK